MRARTLAASAVPLLLRARPCRGMPLRLALMQSNTCGKARRRQLLQARERRRPARADARAAAASPAALASWLSWTATRSFDFSHSIARSFGNVAATLRRQCRLLARHVAQAAASRLSAICRQARRTAGCAASQIANGHGGGGSSSGRGGGRRTAWLPCASAPAAVAWAAQLSAASQPAAGWGAAAGGVVSGQAGAA